MKPKKAEDSLRSRIDTICARQSEMEEISSQLVLAEKLFLAIGPKHPIWKEMEQAVSQTPSRLSDRIKEIEIEIEAMEEDSKELSRYIVKRGGVKYR